jgi:hypothetical protein
LDVPAGDVDVFDDQAEQGLFLVEVEGVDHGQDAGGEVHGRGGAVGCRG